METKNYWQIAVAILAIVTILYAADLSVMLSTPVYTMSPSYEVIGPQRMMYTAISLGMLALFGVSWFLFYNKRKEGFYLSMFAGVVYLINLILSAMEVGEDANLTIAAVLFLMAALLIFCTWKSKPMFKL